MAVDVRFHGATYSDFFGAIEQRHPGISDTLKAEFTRYIESNRLYLPSIFGRDAPYTQPPLALQACMMHIHLKIPPAEFKAGTSQRDRVCKRGRPNEDAALLYVPGELYEDRFLILAVFWPDAHGRANDRSTMKVLARIAKEWRDQN